MLEHVATAPRANVVFLMKTTQLVSEYSMRTDPVLVQVTLSELDGSDTHVFVMYVTTVDRPLAGQPVPTYDLPVNPVVIVVAGAVPVHVVKTKSDGVVTLAWHGAAEVQGFDPPFPADSLYGDPGQPLEP